jgi:hypothetical protein
MCVFIDFLVYVSDTQLINTSLKCFVYTTEFYSATKKSEFLSFAGKWMELENIILSEVSQVQKAKNHVLSHM